MKRTIRLGTFETNSSSTHTLSIFNQEDFDAYCQRDSGWILTDVLNPYERKFFNKITDLKDYMKYCEENVLDHTNWKVQDEWFNNTMGEKYIYLDSGFAPSKVSDGILFESDDCDTICETIKIDTEYGALYIMIGDRSS